MGSLIMSMMVSIDGYIEGPARGDASWMSIDRELHEYVNDMTDSANVLLYGRKVYDAMVPYWPDAAHDPSKSDFEVEFGRIWTQKRKVVVSRTLENPGYNTRLVRHSVVSEIAALKEASPNGVVFFGGPNLASTLQPAGLIDEYLMFLNPVALANGVPLFTSRVDLRFTETRTFGSGVLMVRAEPLS